MTGGSVTGSAATAHKLPLPRALAPRSRVAQRARRVEQLARLEQGLEAGEDHRPAAPEFGVGLRAELIVGDREAAGVAHRLDLPGYPRLAFALDVLAPQR